MIFYLTRLNDIRQYVIFTTPIVDYLQIECCGNKLWALNTEHLDFLEEYVESKLRERIPNINKSLASRLPNWIKDKKNRKGILTAIKKMRTKLINEGYVKRK